MIRRIKALLRRVPPRVRAQGARLVRLFVFAAVPAAVAGWRAHHVLIAVAGAAVTAGAEAVWRQFRLPPEAKQAVAALADLANMVRENGTVPPNRRPKPVRQQVVKGAVLGAGAVPAAPPPPKPAAKAAPAAKKTSAKPVKKT